VQDFEPLDPVIIDGRHLRRPDVVAVARGHPPVHLDAAGRARAHAASQLATRIAAVRPIYGRSTGVGANRIETVTDDAAGHGLRLLRSHASGTGELEPP
jgi:histidine ammonia-lyase